MNPSSKYLMETRSKYINLGQYLGSDYFTSRVGYSEVWDRVKRLGDAYYEDQLITRALAEKLGTAFINGTYVKTKDFVNDGTKWGNGGVTYVEANTVRNETTNNLLSEISGDKTYINAVGNIENIGGRIKGNEVVALISENGKVVNDTTKRRIGYDNGRYDSSWHDEAASLGEISSNGTTYIKANEYTTTGGVLSTKNIIWDVNKLNADALKLSGEDRNGVNSDNYGRYSQTTHLGAGIVADTTSGRIGDMNLVGSTFAGGDTNGLTISGNVNVESVVNSYENESKRTNKGFLSSDSRYVNAHEEENVAGNLQLNGARIEGNLTGIGSNIVLGENSYVGGKVTTDSRELHNSYYEKNRSKGFTGGISHGTISAGYGKSQSTYDEKSTINAKSNLQVGDGSVLNRGAEITATNFEYGNIQINNGDVKYGARIDTRDVHTSSKSSGFTISAGINSPALDRAKQVGQAVSQIKNGDTAGGAMEAVNAATGTIKGLADNQGTRQTNYVNGSVGAKGARDAMANSNFYANIGVNAGFTRSRSNTSSHTEGAAVTTLKPMDENSSITYSNVNNITYQGTQAQGGTFIYNNVANIQKEAVELHNSYSSSSSSRGINAGATIGYGHKIQTTGNGGSISASQSNQNTVETIYANGNFKNVNEVHNNTGSMVLNGFNQEGGKVTGNIGKVEVISRQNTSTTTGSSSGMNLGISANGVPSSVNISGSRTNGDRAFVDNQSSFIVGEGSSLHVGRLENTGAVVGKEGNSTFKIDSYVGKDIQNHDTMKTTGGSLGISTGKPRITNVGFNQDSRDKQGITRNTVIGDVEIGETSGSPINRDITRANEVTKDTHSSTNINVESQTIEYLTNPAKLKEDIGKAKEEINDIKWAIDKSIHDMGDDNRNFFGQLSEVRLNKSLENITGEKLIGKTVDTEIAGIFKDAYKDLGYDINIIFSDPENSPQLLDENDKPKTGTAYVRDENGKKIKTIIINGEDPKNATKAGLIGTIVEEGSHVIGKVEGRQRKTGTDEKGLESTGRASNEYFAEKYKDDNTPISIHSDGKDYSNVDFGENVGDKTIVPSEYHSKKMFNTDKEKANVLRAFIEAYEEKKIADSISWEKYLNNKEYKKEIDSRFTKYLVNWSAYSSDKKEREKINYYYLVALNHKEAIEEFEKHPEKYERVSAKEAVYHNMIGGKIKVTGGLNIKFVNKENGREIVFTSDLKKVVKDPINIGTFNYYTYESLFNPVELFEGGKHYFTDVSNWKQYGTGINDKSTKKEREDYNKLAKIISLNYSKISEWARKKGITHVGFKELEEYHRDNKGR